MLAQLVAALWDDRANAVGPKPASNAGLAVGFVRSETPGTAQWPAVGASQADAVHEGFKASGLVALAGCEQCGQGNALRIGDDVELGSKAAPRAP